MTKRALLGWQWFVFGLTLALLVFGVMEWRNIPGLVTEDKAAAFVLGVLGTVQFGILMPITCIIGRYHAERFNFFNAFLLFIGFTVGTGLTVGYFGAYFIALLYLLISTGILAGFYVITCELDRRIEKQPQKNRPK